MDTNTIINLILLVVVVIAAGVSLFLFIRSRNNKKQNAGNGSAKAGTGEPLRDKKANEAFARKLKSAAWKRGLPLVIPNPEKSPFLGLLVSPAGVTAFYGADYSGTVYGGTDEQWAQIQDGVRRPFRNPMLVAEDARKALRDDLTAAKFGAFLVSAKVVMTAPKAELVIPRNTPVSSMKDVLHDVEYSTDLMANRRVDEEAVKKFLEEKYL